LPGKWFPAVTFREVLSQGDPEEMMSPIRLQLVILTATLLTGPSLSRAAQPPSTTVLVRNARQLHVIVDRDFRASPLYPQLGRTAEQIAQRAESIRELAGHPAALPQIRQCLLELNAAAAQLAQHAAQIPSRTVLQAQQVGYQKIAAAQVTIGKGYVYQATPTCRPQASLNPRDVVRLQNALADVETATADFSCALTAWERTILWDFGGWDQNVGTGAYHVPAGPMSPWGLSETPHLHRRY
jgi:hypothetical protein